MIVLALMVGHSPFYLMLVAQLMALGGMFELILKEKNWKQRPYGWNFVEPDICELEWNRYGSPDNNLRY